MVVSHKELEVQVEKGFKAERDSEDDLGLIAMRIPAQVAGWD